MLNKSLTVLLVGATSLLGACGTSNGPGGPDVGRGPTGTATTSPSDGCPSVTATSGRAVMVDYVDFVRANGVEYVARLGEEEAGVGPADIGAVQFHVRCSFSELNRRTQQMPPPARDGDAGFLPAGSPVHAVNGWSPSCRLAAQHDGSWHVYLALDGGASTAQPRPCSPAPSG